MDDLISVVIPVYNIENYLERCLKSVTEQTYQKLQIILVDDGSTDNSLQLCNQWQEKDGRIEVYHKQNGGVSSARNLGIGKAIGEWIIFVDGDDWLEPDMLWKMYKSVVETESDVAICSFVLEYGSSKEINSVFKSEGFSGIITGQSAVESLINRRLPYNVTNSPCNKLFRRKMIRENHISFPVNRVMAEDMLFAVKALLEVRRCVLLPDALYHYDLSREGSACSNRDSLKSVRDDIELKIVRTKFLYQRGQKYLGEWSQDELIYTLLMKYLRFSNGDQEDDECLNYIREVLKKRIKAKDKKTKVGLLLYRLNPSLFVRVMKKVYRL